MVKWNGFSVVEADVDVRVACGCFNSEGVASIEIGDGIADEWLPLVLARDLVLLRGGENFELAVCDLEIASMRCMSLVAMAMHRDVAVQSLWQ